MPNEINKLKNKIFNKERESDVFDIWHIMMVTYGWIPFNEFMELDSWMVEKLLKKIERDASNYKR